MRTAWATLRCISFWLCVGLLAYWSADRSPPFALVSYSAAPVRRGGVAVVDAVVRRDLGRSCSVEFSRYLFDSRGFRYDLAARQVMTAQGVKRLNDETPDRLRLLVPIPDAIATGRARFRTELEYSCDANPLHQFWPLEVVMEVELEVTP